MICLRICRPSVSGNMMSRTSSTIFEDDAVESSDRNAISLN